MAPLRPVEERRETNDVEVLTQRWSNYLLGLCKSAQTIKAYRRSVRVWFRWWRRPLELFGPPEWDAWTTWMAESGLKARSIRHYQCGVHRFFRWLLKIKVATQDPAAFAEAVQLPHRIPEVLTRDEIEGMRGSCAGLREKALFALLYDCGLRNTEARTLQLSDIHGDHIKLIGKRNTERKVPTVPATRSTLDAWLAERPTADGLVFPAGGGHSICSENVGRSVRAWAKQAGIKRRITAHTLRHSIATHLIEAGMPIENVQEFLGHADINTTRIYVHVAQTRLKSSVLSLHPLASK